MSKKPIYLYFLVFLSSLASLWRVRGVFLTSFQKLEETTDLGDIKDIEISNITNAVEEKLHYLNTDLTNKAFVIAMLVLLIVALLFSFRKPLAAVLTYTLYLLTTVGYHTYGYFNSNLVAGERATEELVAVAQKSATWEYMVYLGLFALYLLIVWVGYLTNRGHKKPENSSKPSGRSGGRRSDRYYSA